MKTPLSFRKGIPFFYDKSESEFQQDSYERYESMVVRQSALHLADELWGHYPFQDIADWTWSITSLQEVNQIAEIGCGVGRLLGAMAKRKPTAGFWGIDFSYQMLRQAQEFWVKKNTIEIDFTNRGLKKVQSTGHGLKNISFGLAKAEQLPFNDLSLDFVFSSFLIDRVEEPIRAMAEMHRVLKPDGHLLLVSPLNFQNQSHWELFFPEDNLRKELEHLGFSVKEKRDILIQEPLDRRGNFIEWKCLGMHLGKSK